MVRGHFFCGSVFSVCVRLGRVVLGIEGSDWCFLLERWTVLRAPLLSGHGIERLEGRFVRLVVDLGRVLLPIILFSAAHLTVRLPAAKWRRKFRSIEAMQINELGII